MRNFKNYAVSHVIGYVLVLLIVTSSIAAVTIWAIPYMEEKKLSVNAESTSLQFQSLNTMIDNIIYQGEGSSNSIELGLNNQAISFEDQGTRFVIYYQLFNYGDDEKDAFIFDVFDFNIDISNHNYFRIRIINSDNKNNYDFIITDITDISNDIEIPNIPIPVSGEGKIEWDNEPFLRDAICIKILESVSHIEYGRVWLFDVGSLNSVIHSNSDAFITIIENGGISSSRVGSGAYLECSPTNFVRELLNGTNIFSFKIIKIVYDTNLGSNSVSGSGSLKVKFNAKSDFCIANQNGIHIIEDDKISSVRLRIYGDSFRVDTWANYFINTLGFAKNDVEGFLFFNDKQVPIISLSLNIINMGMEVIE